MAACHARASFGVMTRKSVIKASDGDGDDDARESLTFDDDVADD